MSQTTSIAMKNIRSRVQSNEDHIADDQGSHSSQGREDEIENGRQEIFTRLAAATALNKVLERPHITGIAVSGTFGLGLFVRTGVMLTLCGGAGTIVAYCIAGAIVTCVMLCLSEMVSFRHSAGVIFDFPSRFVSPALGFAVGIIYWLSYTTSIVTLTATATELLEYSVAPEEIGVAKYSSLGRIESAITMIFMIFVIYFLNVVGGVKVYGKIEWFSKWFKLSIVVSLWCIMIYIIASHASKIDTSYWKHNWGFSPGFSGDWYNTTLLRNGTMDIQKLQPEIPGAGGVVVGIITAVNEAVFSFLGVEILVVAAGEAKDARRDLPRATSQMYILTIGLYVITAILVSFCVGWDNPMLQSYNSPAGGYVGASNSPFIIAMMNAKMGQKVISTYKALFFLSAALTINTDVYVASRTLFALFSNAPKFPWLQNHIGRTTFGRKTPFWAISLSIAPGFLALISLIRDAGIEVIGVFSTIASVSVLCVYAAECWTFIQFQKGVGNRRQTTQYDERYNRIQLQPFWAWFGLIACLILILINGWYYIFAAARQTMTASSVVAGLISSYFGPLLLAGLFGLYIWKYQGKEDIDVWNARSHIETESAGDELRGWRAWRHKIWMCT